MAFRPDSEKRISETVQRSEAAVGNPRSHRRRWHLHKVRGGARIIHGSLVGAITSEDALFDIENVVTICGKPPDDDPVEIYNAHKDDADDGAWVLAIWCKVDDQWEAIRIDCPAPGTA